MDRAVYIHKECGKELLRIQAGSLARVAGFGWYCLECGKKVKNDKTEGYACEKCGSPNCQGDLCR